MDLGGIDRKVESPPQSEVWRDTLTIDAAMEVKDRVAVSIETILLDAGMSSSSAGIWAKEISTAALAILISAKAVVG